MRTKTLLIAAAAMAVGIISSQADPIYSQNVVGYYNVTIPGTSGSTGFQVVGNQFNCGSSNGLNEVFANGGLISDAGGSLNSVVYIWDAIGGVFASYQYFNAADAASDFAGAAGFYDGGGGYITSIIPPGTAVFVQNLNASALTVPIIGSVAQGTNQITLLGSAAGTLNFVSSPIPVSTNVDAAPISFAGTSDGGGTYNDVIYLWDAVGGVFSSFQYFNATDAASDFSGPAGFYDGGGAYQTTAVAPAVGVGFYLQHFGPGGDGTSLTWTNIFKVQ